MGEVLWDGKLIDIEGVKVVRDPDTRWFDHTSRHCGKRTKPIQMGVVHFTASENTPEVLFGNLRRRGLAVEFALDYDGTIHQWADPALTYCAQAAKCNTWSFGLEVICRGVGGMDAMRQFSQKTRTRWDAKSPREEYTGVIRGRKRVWSKFTEAQMESSLRFFETLAGYDIIPRTIYGEPGDKKSILRTHVHASVRKEMSGVVGHFQCSDFKVDPGPQLLEAMAGIEHWEVVNPPEKPRKRSERR